MSPTRPPLFPLWAAALLSGPALGLSFEGDLVSQVLLRRGAETSLNRQLSLSTRLYANSVTVDWVLVPRYDCESDPAPPQEQGDWLGYFQVEDPDARALKLAGAIKGLGFETARRIVAERRLDEKPRSWRDFEDRICELDSRYQTGFSYRVLVLFKRENIANLGFLPASGCPSHLLPERRPLQRRDYARSASQSFFLELGAPALRRGEQERLTLYYDGFADALTVETAQEDYSVKRDTTAEGVIRYRLEGRRRAVPPRNSLEASAGNKDGELALFFRDPEFDPELDRASTRLVRISVDEAPGGWAKGKHLGSFERPLSGARCELADFGIKLSAHHPLRVSYQLLYRASVYFNDQPSPARTLLVRP